MSKPSPSSTEQAEHRVLVVDGDPSMAENWHVSPSIDEEALRA
jgi:hypothetical protein